MQQIEIEIRLVRVPIYGFIPVRVSPFSDNFALARGVTDSNPLYRALTRHPGDKGKWGL